MPRHAFILFLVPAVCLFLCGAVSVAQSQQQEYSSKIDEFFALVEHSQFGEAIDLIYQDNPWMKSKSDDLQKLRAQFVGLPNIVGAYLDHSPIGEKEVIGRFIHLDYLVSFDRQPIRFQFQFYRPKDIWMLYSFAYKDDLDEWLSEASKTSFQFQKLD